MSYDNHSSFFIWASDTRENGGCISMKKILKNVGIVLGVLLLTIVIFVD